MKILKKNDCLNELLKGKTAAKNSYFEFIFMILTVILTVMRNLRLIKQLFSRNYAELSDIGDENKHLGTNQKELKKQNQFVDDKKSLLSDEVLTAKQFNEFDYVNEERCCQKC